MVARRSGLAVFVIAAVLPMLVLGRVTPPVPVSPAPGWEALQIDGNRSGYVVAFPHLDHQERLQDEETGAEQLPGLPPSGSIHRTKRRSARNVTAIITNPVRYSSTAPT